MSTSPELGLVLADASATIARLRRKAHRTGAKPPSADDFAQLGSILVALQTVASDARQLRNEMAQAAHKARVKGVLGVVTLEEMGAAFDTSKQAASQWGTR